MDRYVAKDDKEEDDRWLDREIDVGYMLREMINDKEIKESGQMDGETGEKETNRWIDRGLEDKGADRGTDDRWTDRGMDDRTTEGWPVGRQRDGQQGDRDGTKALLSALPAAPVRSQQER